MKSDRHFIVSLISSIGGFREITVTSMDGKFFNRQELLEKINETSVVIIGVTELDEDDFNEYNKGYENIRPAE